MWESYLKYSEKDLETKLSLTIQTNEKIFESQGGGKKLSRLGDFLRLEEQSEAPSRSDTQNTSINLSYIVATAEEDTLGSMLGNLDGPAAVEQLWSLGQFRRSVDEFQAYKMEMERVVVGLRSVRPVGVRKTLAPADLDGLTRNTMLAIPEMFYSNDFEIGQFLAKPSLGRHADFHVNGSYANSVVRPRGFPGAESQLIRLAEKCDFALMALAFEKFRTFVFSLGDLGEISGATERVRETLKGLRETVQRVRGLHENLRTPAIRRLARHQKLTGLLSALRRLSETRESDRKIRETANSLDFDGAVDAYERARDFAAKLAGSKLGADLASSQATSLSFLSEKLKSEFERIFADYVSFGIGGERDKSKELQLTSAVISLARVSGVSLKVLQNTLYERVSAKVSEFAQQILKQSSLSAVEKLSKLIEGLIAILLRALWGIKTVAVNVMSIFLSGLSSIADILNSRYFILLENLYALLKNLSEQLFSLPGDFFSKTLPPTLSFDQVSLLISSLSKIEESLQSNFFSVLFPPNKSASLSPEFHRNVAKNLIYHFSKNDFLPCKRQLISSAASLYHRESVFSIKTLLEKETWSPIPPGPSLEALKGILEEEDHFQLSASEKKIRIGKDRFLISSSMENFLRSISQHVFLIKLNVLELTSIQKMTFELFASHQDFTLKLILGGGCLKFKTLNKIDANLLLSIKRELDLSLFIIAYLTNHELLEAGPTVTSLCQDIVKHQSSLSGSVVAFVKEAAKEAIMGLSIHNWRDPSFRIITPLPETQALLQVFEENASQLRPVLSKQEASKLIDLLAQVIITDYCKYLENCANLNEAALAGINSERVHIISRIEAIKSSVCRRKES